MPQGIKWVIYVVGAVVLGFVITIFRIRGISFLAILAGWSVFAIMFLFPK